MCSFLRRAIDGWHSRPSALASSLLLTLCECSLLAVQAMQEVRQLASKLFANSEKLGGSQMEGWWGGGGWQGGIAVLRLRARSLAGGGTPEMIHPSAAKGKGLAIRGKSMGGW